MLRHADVGVLLASTTFGPQDHIARLFSKDMWRFGEPPGTPSEMFRRHVWVAPFFEDDMDMLKHVIGVDRLVFGSDFPHAEGLPEPTDYVKDITGFSPAEVRQVMRENIIGLLSAAG